MSDALIQIRTQRGLRSRIARELGITPGAVNQWATIPPHHVLAVEQITGISRHDLRPDIFGPPRAPRAKRMEARV